MSKNIVSREQALEAIRTLLRFIGDNPDREGLLETPNRVLNSYSEIFAGYGADLSKLLDKRFSEVGGFSDMVLLKSIGFASYCEHHMLPIKGHVDIAYFPNGAVLGLSKLARLVDAFAKRLQVQEKMTAQIADALQSHLNPLGVAVSVAASHDCMIVRGIKKESSVMVTSHYTGIFREEENQKRFLSKINI